MSDVQARVQGILDELTGSGREIGLQVAAYLAGEQVVDAWSGLADAKEGRPVDGSTLFTIFSCSKGVTATVVHLLAERGQAECDAPIATYWPEFGGGGKAGITVHQALTHLAGIPQMPEGIGPAELGDWDLVCRGIAGLTPLWEPGTKSGYHTISFGWILGEVARRIDGRPIARILQEDICRPLHLEGLYFGSPDEAEARVARLENGPAPSTPPPPPGHVSHQALPPALVNFARVFNRPDVRRASIPGAGGIGNARSLARHYAALIGEVDGIRLLPPERVRIASTPQVDDLDEVTGRRMVKALGYHLAGELSPMGRRRSVFGHPGAGGSIGFADQEYGFAFALTKNRLIWEDPPDGSTALIVARAARDALGIPEG